jgi:hypothetical protein
MSAVKTSLERYRSKHQYQGFQARKNFAFHQIILSRRVEASRMPTKQTGNYAVTLAVRDR